MNTKRQQENRPTSYRVYQLKTVGVNCDKSGIGQKGFRNNSKDLRNATGPYSEILQIKKKSLIISRSNKMKPPLNASKKTQTVHAGSLKNLRNI